MESTCAVYGINPNCTGLFCARGPPPPLQISAKFRNAPHKLWKEKNLGVISKIVYLISDGNLCKLYAFCFSYLLHKLNFLFSIFCAESFLKAFSTLKHKKSDQVCLNCYVFDCFMNFLCMLLFFNFYVFYCFMISAV